MKFRKKHAVEQAYLDYSDAIFRFLYWQSGDRHLAEDLTSEVFIRAWNKAALFEDPKSNQRAWLYTVARNILNDHWRKKHAVSLEDAPEPVDDYDLAEAAAIADDTQRLQQALKKLDERSRIIVTLRFMERLPVRDVADIVALSEANVRTLQFRALKELKKRM